MKCLSLWQPWALGMFLGIKTNETRSWATSYRGPLAIHASKRWTLELQRLCETEPAFKSLGISRTGRYPRRQGTWYYGCIDGTPAKPGPGVVPKVLPLGAIVCVVNLLDCIEITAANAPHGLERAFGDYTPGRFMWKTDDLRRLPEPVPYTGHQGLFEIPDDLLTISNAGLSPVLP